MKSILSASICTVALAFAVPAMAATDTAKPMHHHHHAGKMSKMGPKTHKKMAGDPSTDDLNAKSLAAARSGTAPASGDTTAAAPAASTAPMAPTSGTTSTMTPTNTPGGQ